MRLSQENGCYLENEYQRIRGRKSSQLQNRFTRREHISKRTHPRAQMSD